MAWGTVTIGWKRKLVAPTPPFYSGPHCSHPRPIPESQSSGVAPYQCEKGVVVPLHECCPFLYLSSRKSSKTKILKYPQLHIFLDLSPMLDCQSQHQCFIAFSSLTNLSTGEEINAVSSLSRLSTGSKLPNSFPTIWMRELQTTGSRTRYDWLIFLTSDATLFNYQSSIR